MLISLHELQVPQLGEGRPRPPTPVPSSHTLRILNRGEDEVGVLDLADPTPGLALTPPIWLPSSVAGLAGFAGTPTPSPPGTGGELAWGIRRRPASGPRISLHPFPSHPRRASGSGEPRPSARLGPFPCRPGPSSRSWGQTRCPRAPQRRQMAVIGIAEVSATGAGEESRAGA